MRRFLIGTLCLALTGCTSTATLQAIEGYETAQHHQQESFDNATKIAEDQMLLNLTQYLKENANDSTKTIPAVTVVWHARTALEETRHQYELGRAYMMLTAGQYLYGQQGALNVLLADKAKDFQRFDDAMASGNQAAGAIPASTQPTTSLKSLLDLLNLKPAK